MLRVAKSIKELPSDKKLIRWHLLDENYVLIKPVEYFLQYKRSNGSAIGTIKNYAQKLKFFWHFLFLRGLNWQKVSFLNIAEFRYWYTTGKLLIQEEKETITYRESLALRSNSTVKLALAAITEFYTYHSIEGNTENELLKRYCLLPKEQRSLLFKYTKRLPFNITGVKEKASKEFPGCLTREQIFILINACSTARDKLIIWILADTGMRIGELLGLHKEDFDWNARILKIKKREDNSNEAYAKGKSRTLSIADLIRDPDFCKFLSEYMEDEYPYEIIDQVKHNLFFVVLHKGSPSYGQPLKPQNINKLLNRLHKKTEIDLPHIYPHLFRHNLATHNIRVGRKKGKSKEELTKALKRQLGHSQDSSVLDIYDHSFSEADLLEELERITRSEQIN